MLRVQIVGLLMATAHILNIHLLHFSRGAGGLEH